MAKKPKTTRRDFDIFSDGDLSIAQDVLSEATAPLAIHENTAGIPIANKDDGLDASDPMPTQTISPDEEFSQLPAEAEPTNISMKIRVKQSTRERFDGFKLDLSIALGGTRLTDSQIVRTLLDICLQELSEDFLLSARDIGGSLTRPGSADLIALTAFDHALGEMFRSAMGSRVPCGSTSIRQRDPEGRAPDATENVAPSSSSSSTAST